MAKRSMTGRSSGSSGFALVEVLIALAILSIVLMSIFSAVSTTLNVLSGVRSSTRAMIIARSKLNEFIGGRMKGNDISREDVSAYPGFYWGKETTRYEHPLLGPLDAKKAVISVYWNDRGRERTYSLTYIYPER